MKDDSGERERQGSTLAKKSAKDLKQDRLKLALRENLKRRKSQARGRGDSASSHIENASPYDDSGEKPRG
jgi:hypothetical protein